MPPQNPITRIRQVAEELRALAEDLEEAVGPEAERALLHWRSELLQAVGELERAQDQR